MFSIASPFTSLDFLVRRYSPILENHLGLSVIPLLVL